MSSFSNLRCHIICTTILFFVVFSSGGCTSWFSLADTAPLAEREEGTGLIIGCIIIIDMVFTRGGEQHPQTTYVDLVYQPTSEKQNKLEIIRVKVDSVG